MRAERLRRSDYLEAGLDILAAGGIGEATISELCGRLGVTKGSFYHHFSSVEDFQSQLLHYWEHERAQALAIQLAAMDPRDRLDALKMAATSLHHEAETAIRAWARTDPMAAATQARVDQAREVALAWSLSEAGVPSDRAPLLARIGMSILIATQQLERPVDRKRLLALFDEYQSWLEWAIESVDVS